MEYIRVYKCLCDRQRLRILNLLQAGPLCVCHLQAILDEGQVKVSKQLAYLRQARMVESSRSGQWVIYALVDEPPALLIENLRCLQDCMGEDRIFRDDLARRSDVLAEFAQTCGGECPASVLACCESDEASGASPCC